MTPNPSRLGRAADLLGILPAIEQHVLTLSQARGGKRSSIDGVRAAAEIKPVLEYHTLFVVIEAEREGTPFTEIAEALNMTEPDAKTWITTMLAALEETET